MHGVDCGDSLLDCSIILGWTLQPTGLTPAQDGTLPVKRYHADSFGVSRDGRRTETSVDDLR
eukprot:2225911-Pleurochrysis_carterae.AAC.1